MANKFRKIIILKSLCWFSLWLVCSSASAQTINIYEGVVFLPTDFVANGDEQITITARGSQFINPPSFNFPVVIRQGETQAPFAFTLDSNLTGGFWSLSLICGNCDPAIPSELHFPTSALGDPLVLEASNQFFYTAGQDFRSFELTFIATGPPTPTRPPVVLDNPGTLVPTIDLLLDED